MINAAIAAFALYGAVCVGTTLAELIFRGIRGSFLCPKCKRWRCLEP